MTRASLLAAGLLASTAHAGIVYTLPPQRISAAAAFPDSNPGSNHAFAPIDIDDDGVPEFTIHAVYTRAVGFPVRGTYLQIERPGTGVRWVEGEGFLPLEAGTLVSVSDFFVSQESQVPFFLEVGLSAQGDWEYGDPPAFFGLRFDINGQTHFGWARAQILSQPDTGYSVTVFDYAYQSEPGAAIVAGAIPAPHAAAVLTIGLLGSVRRRRRPW